MTKDQNKDNGASFVEFWTSMPTGQRKIKMARLHNILKKRAEQQLKEIKILRRDNSTKTVIHQFVFGTVEEFWTDADFVFALGKNKWKNKAYFAARACLDKLAKLGYFSKQKNKDVQERLARMESLRSLRNLYDVGINSNDQEFCNQVKSLYDRLKEPSEPEIVDSKQKLKALSFPDVKQCLEKAGLEKFETLYLMYSEDSELSHGNVFEHLIKNSEDHLYISAAESTLYSEIEMLKLADFHLYGKLSSETEKIIEDFNKETGFKSD